MTKKTEATGFDGDSLVVETTAIENYDAGEIEAGKRFLRKFGIDSTHFTDAMVVDKLEKIRSAKARSVEVLSKGPVLDGIERLLRRVPRGFVGELFLENDVDVARAQSLGWEVFVDAEAKKDTPTGTADGKVRLGDCILMIIPEEVYVANHLVKLERIERRRRLSEAEKARQETSAWTIPVVEL